MVDIMFGLLLAAATFLQAVGAAGNTFTSPSAVGVAGDYSDNQLWATGSKKTVSWTNDYPQYSLWLFQDGDLGDGNPSLIATGSASSNGQQQFSASWTVATTINIGATTPVFWFRVYSGTDTNGDKMDSHYFNISSKSTTSSSPSSSSTTTSTDTSSTSSATSTTDAAVTVVTTTVSSPDDDSQTSNSPNGLSAAAIGGIAAGATVAFIILVIGICWRRKRQQNRRIAQAMEPRQGEFFTPGLKTTYPMENNTWNEGRSAAVMAGARGRSSRGVRERSDYKTTEIYASPDLGEANSMSSSDPDHDSYDVEGAAFGHGRSQRTHHGQPGRTRDSQLSFLPSPTGDEALRFNRTPRGAQPHYDFSRAPQRGVPPPNTFEAAATANVSQTQRTRSDHSSSGLPALLSLRNPAGAAGLHAGVQRHATMPMTGARGAMAAEHGSVAHVPHRDAEDGPHGGDAAPVELPA